MTAAELHRDSLKGSYSKVKIYTIKEYAGEYDDLDISDPMAILLTMKNVF